MTSTSIMSYDSRECERVTRLLINESRLCRERAAQIAELEKEVQELRQAQKQENNNPQKSGPSIVQELEMQISAKDRVLQQVEHKHREAMAELAREKTRSGELHEQLRQRNEDRLELEEAVRVTSEALALSQKNLQAVAEQRNDFQQRVEGVESLKGAVEDKISSLLFSQSELESVIERQAAEAKLTASQAETMAGQLRASLKEALETRGRLEQGLKQEEEAQKYLRTQANVLEIDLADARAREVAKGKEAQSLKVSKHHLEQNMAMLAGQLQALSEDREQLNAALQRERAEAQSLSQQLRQLEEELANVELFRRSSSEALHLAQSSIEAAGEEKATLQSDLDALAKDYETVATELSALRDIHAQVERAAGALQVGTSSGSRSRVRDRVQVPVDSSRALQGPVVFSGTRLSSCGWSSKCAVHESRPSAPTTCAVTSALVPPLPLLV